MAKKSNFTIEPLYSDWDKLEQWEFDLLCDDFFAFCEEGHIILDKALTPVRLVLNEAQRMVADFIIPRVFTEDPYPINLLIHKSRQQGITTVLMALEQFICTFKRGIRVQHVMPTEDEATTVFETKFIPMIKGTHPDLIPITHQTARSVEFRSFGGEELESSVIYKSERTKGGSHGSTYQFVILDEYAIYNDPRNLELGLLGSVPKDGLAITVFVSTAKGGNHFKEKSDLAKEDPDNWDYLFIPWYVLSEYEKEPKKGSRLDNLSSLEDHEMDILEQFEKNNVPKESWIRKLAWYDYTYKTEASRDIEHMWRNYPTTADESFRASGSTVLPMNIIEHYETNNTDYYPAEFIDIGNGKVVMQKTDYSSMLVRREPIKGRRYIIGADPAEGIDDADNSAIVVIDLTTMEAVCSILESVSQTEFAEMLSILGEHYNFAKIVVESNIGNTTIDWLKMGNYPNLYIDVDRTNSNTVQYGYYMTLPRKRQAVNKLKFIMNNHIYSDFCPEFINEARSFVYKRLRSNAVTMAAVGTAHDDAVMARVIAVAAMDANRWKGYREYAQEKNAS